VAVVEGDGRIDPRVKPEDGHTFVYTVMRGLDPRICNLARVRNKNQGLLQKIIESSKKSLTA
jgi:hypothetical protein